MQYSIVIRNSQVPESSEPVSIGIIGGQISRIGTDLDDGEQTFDANGGLVTGGLVDCHVHLDKALIEDSLPVNESGTLNEAIDNIQARKDKYTVEDVRNRAKQTIEMHVRNRCTRIRSHVDVDTISGLTPLYGVLEAREACADIADVQIVAFPQEGIIQDPGTEDLLKEALEEGADIIGGMPDNERSEDKKKDAC